MAKRRIDGMESEINVRALDRCSTFWTRTGREKGVHFRRIIDSAQGKRSFRMIDGGVLRR
jgi:hypothetical protein